MKLHPLGSVLFDVCACK